MQDSDCVRFLQWSLPRLQMRWAGFRKVHNRVCKRLNLRLRELNLSDLDAYRRHLAQQPDEWLHLDTLCRVVVTRFYRDKMVFSELTTSVLPQLAAGALALSRSRLRVWSIGSASGEEPYTLAILWLHRLAPRFPQIQFSVLATEIDPVLIERSHHACYAPASLKNLPPDLLSAAFAPTGDGYCLKSPYQALVEFRQQDIRTTLPEERFDLILCRNLVFTYFDESQQRTILRALLDRLLPGGGLLLGVHETLPAGSSGLRVVSARLGLYQSDSGSAVLQGG